MAEITKKRVFRQFNYKGKSLEELMVMPLSEFGKLLDSKARRHLKKGINKYEDKVLQEVEKCQEAVNRGEKPGPIKTTERSMIIFPCMIGLTIAVHCGNGFFPLEIKPEMIGMKLREFIPTRVICTHGKPGVGATSGSKFVPLK